MNASGDGHLYDEPVKAARLAKQNFLANTGVTSPITSPPTPTHDAVLH